MGNDGGGAELRERERDTEKGSERILVRQVARDLKQKRQSERKRGREGTGDK